MFKFTKRDFELNLVLYFVVLTKYHIIQTVFGLFASKRFHRVKAGGFTCRIKSAEYADDD